eukprot:scaffold105672_cov34-Tisochrysis_lutea.AAC.1
MSPSLPASEASSVKTSKPRGGSNSEARGVRAESLVTKSNEHTEPSESIATVGAYNGPSRWSAMPWPGWYSFSSTWLGGALAGNTPAATNASNTDSIHSGSGSAIIASGAAWGTPPRFCSRLPRKLTQSDCGASDAARSIAASSPSLSQSRMCQTVGGAPVTIATSLSCRR